MPCVWSVSYTHLDVYKRQVLDGADGLPLAELAPIIARGHQLVVIDDLTGASEGGATRELAGVLPVVRVEPGPRRLNDQVALRCV